jgi:hypothetical protein
MMEQLGLVTRICLLTSFFNVSNPKEMIDCWVKEETNIKREKTRKINRFFFFFSFLFFGVGFILIKIDKIRPELRHK